MALKKCSRCEIEFNCQNETKGCWCENYSLKEKVLVQLKKDFDNCLCEDCLKEHADSETKIA